ncbi:helix-turn-helix transcriptional regulator [Vitiosangium sp. GDMCC 1.1324]|uniref:ArsR/SmtB family transcription factor n=1 Tax=Vitiosangium sp. (strain GDMCC 1.1324) TaxID=2138576 RepID=UPI000D39E978|nr:metalloregulator ArsR/SmtB family transcription factor [Vitiosangium sp. GDMCC 1.1324]PTL82166.1 transcriptional regulator [Vitiosangium sp. GDMCC 1.1324]
MQTDVFKAISDPNRRQLLALLAEGDRSVTELMAPFRISQPAISQHLKVLREAGLVSERRVGRHRHYRLNPAPLREVFDWVAHFEQFWLEKLRGLEQYLDEEDP